MKVYDVWRTTDAKWWQMLTWGLARWAKKDTWPRIILSIPSVNWTILFDPCSSHLFTHIHTHFSKWEPIVSPLLRAHVFSKFVMETRLNIHLTFAEIHYRIGSDTSSIHVYLIFIWHPLLLIYDEYNEIVSIVKGQLPLFKCLHSHTSQFIMKMICPQKQKHISIKKERKYSTIRSIHHSHLR